MRSYRYTQYFLKINKSWLFFYPVEQFYWSGSNDMVLFNQPISTCTQSWHSPLCPALASNRCLPRVCCSSHCSARRNKWRSLGGQSTASRPRAPVSRMPGPFSSSLPSPPDVSGPPPGWGGRGPMALLWNNRLLGTGFWLWSHVKNNTPTRKEGLEMLKEYSGWI